MSNAHYKETDVRTMTEADGTIAFQTEANIPTALQGAVRNTLSQLNKKSLLKERMRANLVTKYKSSEFKDKIVEKLDKYDFSLPPDDERIAEQWEQDGYHWRITKRIWNWKEEGDSLEIYITASRPRGTWSAYVYLADAPTKYKQEGLRPYKNTRYMISV
jgi:hypothetical protein